MKTKSTITVFFTFLFSFIYAQQITYLDIANVNALINADGNLFQDINNFTPGFEIPKNSNKYTIYASSLWFTSTSTRNGIPHVATAYETYGSENQFNVGPVDIVNQTSLNANQFNKLWKVNKSEINNHILNWNSSNYVTPNSILNWPGNGTSNTAQNLAPYADLDGDNIYEPQSGEYPIIKGDQAVYLILNDYRNEDTLRHLGNVVETYGPLKIELHLMLYAYASSIPTISNTVFVESTIYNRSNSPLDDHSDLKSSVFVDFDLGNFSDDFVGTSTSKNLIYAYNGDMFDESVNGHSGFGNQLAAQGVLFLDYNIDHSIYFNSGSSQNGDPTLPRHFANYQRGFWKNSNQIRYGGDGYISACTTNTFTKLMFDGDPSLQNSTGQWTEANPCINSTGQANAPGDRRMVGGPSIPSQLNHGQSIQFNYAYIFAQDDQVSGSIGSPVNKLFQEADVVKTFYNTVTSAEQLNQTKTEFQISPNPASNFVRLDINSQDFEVQLLDIKGSLLYQSKNESMIDLSSFNNGIYFLRMIENNQIQTKKIIISR